MPSPRERVAAPFARASSRSVSLAGSGSARSIQVIARGSPGAISLDVSKPLRPATASAWSLPTNGSAAELDLEGLRPYRQGTPASRIHWPAVARSGEMLERRLSADGDTAPLVVLDASRTPTEEALDHAVRAAASLCLHLARRGGCALLLPGCGRAASLTRAETAVKPTPTRATVSAAQRDKDFPAAVATLKAGDREYLVVRFRAQKLGFNQVSKI